VLRDRHVDVLDEREDDDDRDVRSRSEAARELIDEYQDLQKQYEDLQNERDRLENRVMTLIDDRQERQELVRYVDEEQRRREAGLVERAKWWIFGRQE
jgi:uncharacterized protein YlxW (UPF0749 family)